MIFDPTIPLQIEHDFAEVIEEMNLAGVGFDVDSAEKLDQTLEARRVELRDESADTFSPVVKEWLTPVKQLPRRKETPVNPNSRVQTAHALMRDYGWQPLGYGSDGHPTLDEEALEFISDKQVPIIDKVKEQFSLGKILGRLSGGDQALLRHVVRDKPGGPRVYGYTHHNGTRTHRCSHRVVSNIPRPTSPWGRELRGLFVPRRGWKMVGVDCKGIEARGMAHYLWPFDGGALAGRIPTGDIHSDVWDATRNFGVDSRNDSKTNFYATTYGAHHRTVAAKNNVSEELGLRIQEAILNDAVPGLGDLIEAVVEEFSGPIAKTLAQPAVERGRRSGGRGYLYGLDGRRIFPAKEKAAFNALIQCLGAIVMKVATKLLHSRMAERGEPCGKSWNLVIHYHDEYEGEAHPDVAELLLEVMIWAIQEAGERLGVKCQLDGEGKIGNSWAEVH